MSTIRFKRKIKHRIARVVKGFRYGIWSMNAPKNSQERKILRVVKTMIEKDENVLFYSPDTGSMYVYTTDKKYMVVFDRYHVNISNHNYFYTYGISESLGNAIHRCAVNRLERDRTKLEQEIFFNERNFLNDVYKHVK